MCRSRAFVSRPFLRRCANKTATAAALSLGWANRCRSALWGSLRHKPAREQSRPDRAFEVPRLLGCLRMITIKGR